MPLSDRNTILEFLERLPVLEADLDCDEVDEANVTSGGEAVKIPAAFAGGPSKEAPYGPRAVVGDRNSGFPDRVSRARRHFESVNVIDRWLKSVDSVDVRLHEVSYSNYVDAKGTTGRPVLNAAISDINSALYRIEQLIAIANKVKSQNSIKPGDYWAVTKTKINQIDARIHTLALKIKELTR